jgi:hypothetical protein
MDAPSLRSGTRFACPAIIVLSALAVLFLLGAGPAGAPPANSDPQSAGAPLAETKAPAGGHVSGRELIDLESVADLDARFRRGRGEPRLVLILSPTCIDCIRAARWLERDLLTRHPKLPFRVYALWFHRLKTDRRDVWPREAMSDRRVEHFWEAGSSISRWYGKLFRTRRPVPWNVYFLYTAGADSLGVRDSVVSWGSWVSDSREKIRTNLAALTGEEL